MMMNRATRGATRLLPVPEKPVRTMRVGRRRAMGLAPSRANSLLVPLVVALRLGQ